MKILNGGGEKACDYNYYAQKYLPEINFSNFDLYALFDKRVFILNSILDLGIKLYGFNFEKLPDEFIILKSAYDNKKIYTLKQNQDLYNSSKINISINHPQCKRHSFPWRTFDIMASDGVLVAQYTSHLKNITKGFVDIPMYESAYDARELCKKLLKDDGLRNSIVVESNKFIEKYGRWDDNIKKIAEYTKTNIYSGNNINDKYDDIIPCIKYKINSQESFVYKIYLVLYKYLQKKLSKRGLI